MQILQILKYQVNPICYLKACFIHPIYANFEFNLIKESILTVFAEHAKFYFFSENQISFLVKGNEDYIRKNDV